MKKPTPHSFAKGGNLSYLLTPNPQIDTNGAISGFPPLAKGG